MYLVVHSATTLKKPHQFTKNLFVEKSSPQFFLFLVLLVVLSFYSEKILADNFILKEWQETYHLLPYTEIAEDQLKNITVDNIHQQLAQISFQSLGRQDFPLVANQYYWGKITLQNNLPNAERYEEWVLDMSYSLTECDVFIQTPDGTFQHQQSARTKHPYRLCATTPRFPYLKKSAELLHSHERPGRHPPVCKCSRTQP